MSKAAHILIIDDTEANVYAFARLLKKAGYTTDEAENGTKGLSLLDPNKIDLVILDVQLPDINGFDICAQIKSNPELSSIPVLMTSASFVESHDKVQGLDSGADGYLTTPIDPQELTATVRALLRIRDAEKKLKEAYEKAEAANNAKTDFLANMSHEIRTPMNAIIGLTSIIASTPLSQQQQKYIATLQESANSLLTLINDMLDITKIEENMIELESAPFNLKESIERIVSMMSLQASSKNVVLSYTASPTLPEQLMGDGQRLHQSILNIVSNAIKFTENGSVLISINEDADSDMVSIKITDSGIGIAKEKLDLIFNKFTQADNSTTRKYGGSGLGLTISRKLIEQMGGTIAVESEVGAGSVFTINIPLKASKKSAGFSRAALESLRPLAKGQGNILLVEDHLPNVLVASTYLEQFGYKCVTANSGVEALSMFKKQTFDIVLMDIQMQDMDGYEATRKLRLWEKSEGKGRVPIIAMTAHVLTGDREKCLNAGMDDYISKPIVAIELERKLSKFMAAA